jgi:heptose-I-phosphate ethanolaminephosphotransferase
VRGWTRAVTLVPLAVILAAHPFGDPLRQLLDGRPGPAGQYLVLGALWAVVAYRLAVMGMAARAVFYPTVFGLFLLVERINFGAVSLPAALVWSNLLWLALVIELLVERLLAEERPTSVSRVFAAGFQCALISLPTAVLVYNWSLNAALDMDAMFAIYQTDPAEAMGFVREYFDARYAVLLALLPALLLITNGRRRATGPPLRVSVPLAFAVALPLAAVYLHPSPPSPRLPALLKESFRTYRMELAAFRDLRAQRAAGVGRLVASKPGPGETFIVVIGESQNRDHMSAYGHIRPTTPWLEAVSDDEGFLLFENAYSNHTHTVPVMGLALTEASQYDDQLHYESASILDIANQAGFETYWITNQVPIGAWDNLVTAMAEASRHSVRLNRHFGPTSKTNVHDGETVEVLRGLAPGLAHGTNNLVFVHLMGNHAIYCDRFPDEYDVFDGGDPFIFGDATNGPGFARRMGCYESSVLYTDQVIAGLFEVARGIENLAGFVYFADHGQAVVAGTGHNSARFRYEMARMPLFVWLSDDHRASRPERFERLRARRDHVFTNDLIYEMLIGLTGIETPHYEPAHDPGSDRYDLTLDRARTLHGTRRIADDPAIVQARFTRGLQAGRVIAHRVNTLGKQADAARAGFDGVEMDLVFRSGAGGGRFEFGHDPAGGTLGDLESYLAAAGAKAFSKLWFDTKNLDTENRASALRELERLAARFPGLKARTIIESSTRDGWFADFGAREWHTSYYLPTGEILSAMRGADSTALARWATLIAGQVRAQRAAAVSFDIELYPFVQDHLERVLDGHVVYHTWDLAIRAWEPDARVRLEASPYFRDERVRTIIVAMDSPYSN